MYTYEERVRLGREAAKSQWVLGDLALEQCQDSKYGEATLESFAEAIGVEYNSLRQYRTVSEAYPQIATRVANLWTVYRDLASQEDRHELVKKKMTVKAARELVRKRNEEFEKKKDILEEGCSRMLRSITEMGIAFDSLKEFKDGKGLREKDKKQLSEYLNRADKETDKVRKVLGLKAERNLRAVS